MSGRDVLDDGILAIATVLAAIGVGGLILDEVRAARAEGRGRFSAELGWTLPLGDRLERALRGSLGITTVMGRLKGAFGTVVLSLAKLTPAGAISPTHPICSAGATLTG